MSTEMVEGGLELGVMALKEDLPVLGLLVNVSLRVAIGQNYGLCR